ncbi:MAG: nuclear transport factor 2 family protein [Candidatus Omnitrophica bacterium]|nr:nuclear transport factor 2 family protein [Candidatus Omnitrophota bacterium]
METYISLSEQWTEDQKEIWKVIEDHWDCLVNGKVDQFKSYIHPRFVGFGHESPYPVDQGWLFHWVGFWSKSTKFLIHALKPQHIVIHGDIAIVQYCLFTITKNDVSAGNSSIRRYTMTWKKEDGKWRVIASHNNLQGEN